jgi:hypothetical protein
MLPGFRFLVAAFVFSFSVIVFGLGAAALFRAAHEQFASSSSWHASPETSFTSFLPQVEPARPMIAMLRVEPAAPEPVNAPPAPAEEQTDVSSTDAVPDAPSPALAEISPPAPAALPEDATVTATSSRANVDVGTVQVATIAPTEAASPPAAPAAVEAAAPASPQPESAVRSVTVAAAPVTIETAAIPPISAPRSTEGQALAGADVVTADEPTASQFVVTPRQDPIALKLAALGEQPSVNERTASLKTASVQLRQSLAKKRLTKARLAKERLADARRARQRQVAQRARAARNAAAAEQQQQQQQQYANPFAQPQGFGQQPAFGQQAAQQRTR